MKLNKILFLLGLSCFTAFSFAADDKPLLINEKNHNREVNLGFAIYGLDSVINILANDAGGLTEDAKAQMVGDAKRLTPFEIKRQRAELIKQYDEGIKKAQEYFSSGLIQIDGSLNSYFDLNNFEKNYDFNDQVMAVSGLNLCEENKMLYHKFDLFKKENCTSAYVKFPEDQAELVYNELRKRYISLQYSILASHQNKVENCGYNYACLNANLEKATIRLVSNDKHRKVLFEAPLEFK